MNSLNFTPRVRSLPFSLAACLKKIPDVRSLIELLSSHPQGGLGYALELLGYSLGIEYDEAQLQFTDRVCAAFGYNEDSKNFIRQEAAHGGYHSILNRFIEPKYIKFTHGPHINSLCYPVFAHDEVTFRSVMQPKLPEERDVAIKKIILRNAAFESYIGIVGSLAFFMAYEEYIEEVNICPFIDYLFLYHVTEELEHVHISIQAFENYYKQPLFEGENLVRVLAEMDVITWQYSAIQIGLGQKFGFNPTYADFEKTSFSKKFQEISEKIKVGFNINDVANLRRHYIDLFDKKWEPLLRGRVSKYLDSSIVVPRRSA